MLALAAIYNGATRTGAAAIGSVTVQIVRDWVVKFNQHGPSGLIDRKPPGQPSRLRDLHRAALVQAIEDGPTPSIHGVVRWRLIDLCQWLWDNSDVRVAKPTLSREVRALGYRKLTARPRHPAQAEGAIETFKKNFPARLAEVARRLGVNPADIEIWFGDQARIGSEEQDCPAIGPAGLAPVSPA